MTADTIREIDLFLAHLVMSGQDRHFAIPIIFCQVLLNQLVVQKPHK